jgi:hypothetical protein
MSDPVTAPSHYKLGNGLEVLDVMESLGWAEGYLKANALKYLMRHEHKGNPVEDLKKARYCLDRLIGLLETKALRNQPVVVMDTSIDPVADAWAGAIGATREWIDNHSSYWCAPGVTITNTTDRADSNESS